MANSPNSATAKDVMTASPLTLLASATIADAAKAMRDKDVGSIIVLEKDDTLCGIVTDRDIVVRAVANGAGVKSTLSEICSDDVVEASPDTPVDELVRMMSEKAIRRVPVLDHGKVVGIVSIGDLAMSRDPDSCLGNISAAPANR